MTDAATHACPACGRELDPIHAGQVAFVGGRFVYFCSRDHKTEWLASLAPTASDDVATAEPPPVAIVEAPPISLHDIAPISAPPAASTFDEEPRSMPIRRWAAPDDAPASLRVDRASTRLPATPRWTVAVAYFGGICGALAIGVVLLGPSADAFRLPLALAACASSIVYAAAIAPRWLARSPWALSVAVIVASVCAVFASATGAPSAPTLASFAGVASASFIVLCLAILRATEPVASARATILGSLDVSARTGSDIVPCAEVRAGEQVTVLEGDTVPVDGVVASGEAVISPWLDAKTDVTRREGMPVVAGARVLSGSLRVTATWTGADRAFVKLLALPRARAFASAPMVGIATLLDGRVIAPVCLLAGGVAFANGASVVESFASAAAAMTAFATPVASFAVVLLHVRGHLRALQNGVVHRDARHFDRAGRAVIAVVCARGTVLLGEPEIVAIEAVGSNDSSGVMALACAAATGSPHPFAAAILRAARARGVRAESVRNPVHSGSGATAVDAQGERIVLGRRAFLLGEKVSVAIADELVRDHEAQGRSVLLVARGGKVAGLVALQDGLRAGARAAVQKLHDARIEPVLLSGEARETCEAIGRALDIEHLRPEVAGPERGAEVRALAEGGDVVAVLGHPAADDSALGAADVSVALDAAGASPGEWSVALASDDVRAAAEALTIARLARERSVRAMAIALVPGTIAALALAFQLLPTWAAPVIGVTAASIALLYAKE